ncbi:alpha/beta hydrolase family protein [Leucobacter musarum]|uniref:alpha/beta hydrolase family protein n=1 Tax=Leucobacter musarum TaxID=1930747 RepID=UPI001EFBD083|nr:alpha/beta fold hydrolase [Leucobacter musarum]
MPVVVIVTIFTLAIAVGFFVTLRYFARRIVALTLPPVFKPVLDWRPQENTIRLPLDAQTRRPGEYGLWWDDRTHHARVGQILHIDESAMTIERELLTPYDAVQPSRVEWTGQVFKTPVDLGYPFVEPTLTTVHGSFPAWHFQGDGSNWVIHVHGLRATRLSPLRGVPAFQELGYHSLVVSYRGDSVDGHPSPYTSSTLGMQELSILDEAITYARSHGAKRILLMGWSMGGGMALLASERGVLKGAIDGLVLVAPTSDWGQTILHGAQQARVPAWVAETVMFALSHPRLCRALGADAPIDFSVLDWTVPAGRVVVPTLVLHSPGDAEVPIGQSRQLAVRNERVIVREIADADHTLEWNRSPDEVETAIKRWVAEL